MCGFDLAELYTMQHGLARYAQGPCGLLHGDEAVAGRLAEARLEFVGQTYPPGRAWGCLLTGDEAVVEPAMQGRWRDVQRGGGGRDGHDLSFCNSRLWLEAWDAPIVT